MLLARVAGGKNRQPLSRRQNHRRRLPRQRPGSAQRRRRHGAAQRATFSRRSSATRPAAWPLAKACSIAPAPTWARASGRCAGATATCIAAARAKGICAMISHLGAMIPVVAGVLLARRFAGAARHASARRASAMAPLPPARFTKASIWRPWKSCRSSSSSRTTNTPTPRRPRASLPAAIWWTKRSATASTGHSVDGTDLDACLEVVGKAVQRARAGGGPQLVVASLLRLAATANTTTRITSIPKLRESGCGRDCLKRRRGTSARRRLGRRRRSLRALAGRSRSSKSRKPSRTALREPLPDPYDEDWCAPRHAPSRATGFLAAMITYLEAIREAQAKALADDPRVYIYGQDVGAVRRRVQGHEKSREGISRPRARRADQRRCDDRLGHRRGDRRHAADHRDAVRGFLDRRLQPDRQPGGDAATGARNVPCPITIRLPSGGTAGSGPFHSQSMEALYAHYPGLIVMTPATVEDAYSMLLEAVAIDDPVIFCEHKYLYYHLKAEALADRSRADRQGAHRARGPRRDHRHLQRDGSRSARRAPRNSRPKAGKSKSSTCARSSRSTPTPSSPSSRAPAVCSRSAKRGRGAASPPKSSRASPREGFGLLDAPPHAPQRQRYSLPYHPNLWGTHRPTARTHQRRPCATFFATIRCHATNSDHHAAARRIDRRGHRRQHSRSKSATRSRAIRTSSKSRRTKPRWA